MFNETIFNIAINQYKNSFVERWPKEKYKWEAVNWFQDKWDINAVNFTAMLEEALAKTGNLLSSRSNYPAGMIKEFSKMHPEKVRAMFINLFDESKSIYHRVKYFKENSEMLLSEYGEKNHYQNENAIFTYLWLRYPDKYYIYKISEIKEVSQKLSTDYNFTNGHFESNINNFLLFYNEICAKISEDKELIDIFKSQLTESCYEDSAFRTLTFDFGFFVSRCFENDKWFPIDYNPNISKEEWLELIEDKEIFTTGSLEILKRIMDYGGKATCKQLSIKYGESVNFYNKGASSLAQRVQKKTNCQVYNRDDESNSYWPILFMGQNSNGGDGVFIWKVRDELASALKETDLSAISLMAQQTRSNAPKNYWLLVANPKIWSMQNLPVNEIQTYTLYNDNGNKRRIFQNFLDAKVGDVMIGYEATPVKQIVAIFEVCAEQDGKEIVFRKIESLINPISLEELKKYKEIEKMEYFQNSQGTLFKLTEGEFEFIMDVIREENPLKATKETIPTYDADKFLEEVYISEEKYDQLCRGLSRKKNIILQGAPGVGKTFISKRLAYSLLEKKDDDKIGFVQFHQSYSYEDFVMGYKPFEDSFKLEKGIFYRFCKKAKNDPKNNYYFIIDEINRGNLSKVFGELLMAIEPEYRDTRITLAYDYNDLEEFCVPSNVYIIGMMNTADRSLAMLDYALRRRFCFFDIEPGFESVGFKKYQTSLNNDTFNEVIDKIKELNSFISIQDKSLGKGFCIGHSYFSNIEKCDNDILKDIIELDILPMLREYWFDDDTKYIKWENQLIGVFK